MTVKEVIYIQYRCLFHKGSKPDLLIFPVDHPKFTSQQGCNYLWRFSNNHRDKIAYGKKEFKLHYNRKTTLGRVFSRLLAITLQESEVRGLQSILNHCIISDIAVLIVALAAQRLGKQDKNRHIRNLSFIYLRQEENNRLTKNPIL